MGRWKSPISPFLEIFCGISSNDPLVLLSLWLLVFSAVGRSLLVLFCFMYSRRKYNAAKFFIMLPTSIFVYKMANDIKTEYQILQIPTSVLNTFILREKILHEWGNIKKLMEAQ